MFATGLALVLSAGGAVVMLLTAFFHRPKPYNQHSPGTITGMIVGSVASCAALMMVPAGLWHVAILVVSTGSFLTAIYWMSAKQNRAARASRQAAR